MSSIIVKKKVTNLTANQWFNRDDSGQEIAGRKNIQVNLEGGYSFRSQEGDDNFEDILDFVRIGMVIEVECSDINPAPFKSTQATESGDSVEVTRYFKNLVEPKLVDFSDPIRNERFKDRQKKSETLVFAHTEGKKRTFGKKTDKPEDVADAENDGKVAY